MKAQSLSRQQRLYKKRERKRTRRIRKLRKAKELARDLLFQFKLTLNHFFPKLDRWLGDIEDPRQSGKIKYGIQEMMWIGLLIICTPTESMNEYNEDFFTEEAVENLNRVFHLKLKRIPDRGTLANLWKKLSHEELEKLRRAMIQTLIRSRSLERFRVFGRYLVAIDGVETHRFNSQHCPHCLHTTTQSLPRTRSGGKTQYFHRILEAKLICDNGLTISIGSEFIENSDSDKEEDNKKEDDKQDCELKAFYRLASRLKADYPRLPITLLMDAMFSVGPVFQRCRENDWRYIITLKDGNLPSVWQEFEAISKLDLQQLLDQVGFEKDGKQTGFGKYQWVNEIAYKGKEFDGFVNVVVVYYSEEKSSKPCKYAFITDIPINCDNVREVITFGRKRWKIENEGFNTQKNGVYELEHLYSKDPNGMKIVYLLIQIGHLLNQLVILADLIKAKKVHQIDTLKSFLQRLKEALIALIWDEEMTNLWQHLQKRRFQARWDPDP